MAIALLENFRGLGVAANVDIKTLTPRPYGAVPGIYSIITNGSAMAGGADIVNLVTIAGKVWMFGDNSGNRMFGPDMNGLGIPAGNSTIVFGVRFRARVPSSSPLTNQPLFKLGTTVVYCDIPAGMVEFYAEVVFNRETGVGELFIDGASFNTFSISGTNLTNLRASTSYFQALLGTAAFIVHTDVYIVHDTQDASVNGRMGAIDITSVPLKLQSSQGFDVSKLADVLARQDYATDTGTRVKGSNDLATAELKLTKADNFKLPVDTPVLGMCLAVNSVHSAGSPGNLQITHKRGDSSQVADVVQSSIKSVLPNAIVGSSSKTAKEQNASTALDGLEISLKVMNR